MQNRKRKKSNDRFSKLQDNNLPPRFKPVREDIQEEVLIEPEEVLIELVREDIQEEVLSGECYNCQKEYPRDQLTYGKMRSFDNGYYYCQKCFDKLRIIKYIPPKDF